MNSIQTNAGQKYLTEAEEKKLFTLLKNLKDCMAERDYILIKLTRATGLRAREVLSLDVCDVAGKEQIEINDRIAKKGGTGKVYIPVDVQELLKRFLRLKKKWGQGTLENDPLFVSRKGNRLSYRAFHDSMAKWCKKAEIPTYGPHALRHTKAQRIMADVRLLSEEEQRKKLFFVNKQLRHRNFNSTLIYATPTKEEMERIGEI